MYRETSTTNTEVNSIEIKTFIIYIYYIFIFLSFENSSYFQEIESKRVVLSLEIEKSMKSLDYEKYQCNSDKVYMIVGKELL